MRNLYIDNDLSWNELTEEGRIKRHGEACYQRGKKDMKEEIESVIRDLEKKTTEDNELAILQKVLANLNEPKTCPSKCGLEFHEGITCETAKKKI